MIAAVIVAIALAEGDPDVLRANLAEAETHGARIEAGLAVLDDLLNRQWSLDLTVELALIGLPDAARSERAAAFVDEALIVTDDVDAALRAAASDGTHVNSAAARWRRARGLACAAASVLDGSRIDRSVEAVTHLRHTVECGGDAAGRLRRMRALIHLFRGEIEQATQRAAEVVDDSAATPLQRTLAEAILLRCGGGQPEPLLAAADAEWQVVLLGEAILRASSDTASALKWIGTIRAALHRCGMSANSSGELAAAMAARLATPVRLGEAELASLDSAAIVGAVRRASDPSVAAAWMGTLAARGDCGPDEWLVATAQAECLGRAGDPAGAMRAWRTAASVGGASAARCWDEAGRHAVVLLNTEQGDATEARAVLEEAARNGSMRAAWMRSLAVADAARGNVPAALDRLADVPPVGPPHLRALEQIGHVLRDRRARLGRWSSGDRDRLEAARIAARAAADQRADPGRAAAAAPIAAVLTAMLIEWHLDQDDLDTAAQVRGDAEAIEWLSANDLAFLDARMAAMGNECDAVAGVLNGLRAASPAGHDELVKRLVVWAGGPSPADANLPCRPAALNCVLRARSAPSPSGTGSELLQMAEALARGGHCDWAVAWFNVALLEDATLLPAVLGRCECLRESTDLAVLAEVARNYRRIAALPREDDPARWRLAQVRLLEVLRRAGADPARIEARLARLRAMDPLVDAALPRGGR